jgi:hypothetical protein
LYKLLIFDDEEGKHQQALNPRQRLSELGIRLALVEQGSRLGRIDGLKLVAKLISQAQKRLERSVRNSSQLPLLWFEPGGQIWAQGMRYFDVSYLLSSGKEMTES